MDRYDEDCIPANYTAKRVSYIQSHETNKTCTRKLIVSPKSSTILFTYLFDFSGYVSLTSFAISVSENVCWLDTVSGSKANEKSCFYLLST